MRIILFLFILFFSITSQAALTSKFQLPESFPYNYYEERFEEKGVVYHEIIPTKMEWLVLFIVKKPDPVNHSQYSDAIIFLLDNRVAHMDGRSRMAMIIHTKKNKLFFAATDMAYFGKKFQKRESPVWKISESSEVSSCQKVLRGIIKKLEEDAKIKLTSPEV